MPIITISRGSYSRGKEVAEKVAERLGYECISRDILLEASAEFNIPEIKLIRALHDAPSVLERFTYGKERYVSYIRSALLQHIRKDNVVYHGLSGHFFLQDMPNVLKVRIIADMEDRVAEEMKRENISADKALYILKKDDDERRRWSLHLYGTDPWDSRLFDMVLHIKTLSVEDAIEMIIDTVRKPIFQTTAQAHKIMDDLALAAKVQAKLVDLVPKIKVDADDGVIYVGNIGEALKVENKTNVEIKKIAGQIEGVKELKFAYYPSRDEGRVNPFHNI